MAGTPDRDVCDAVPYQMPSTQPGGYPVEIFKDGCDEKYKCNYCNLILREPLQSFCGHRFCRPCIQHVKALIARQGTPVNCKKCEEEAMEDEYIELKPDQMFPDNAVKKEMSSVKVHCINPGCYWTGLFKNYPKHYDECPHLAVVCECGTEIPRSRLKEHQDKECPSRKIPCKFCAAQIMFSQREVHNQECVKMPVKCESCGRKKIPRDKMEEHLMRECPNPRLLCTLGCNELVEKSKVDQHLSTPAKIGLHLRTLGQKIEATEQQIREVAGALHSPNIIESIQSTLSELNERIRMLEEGLRRLSSTGASTVTAGAEGSATANANTHELIERMKHYETIVTVLHAENQRCIVAIDLEREQREAADRRRHNDRQTLESYDQKIHTLERILALKDVMIAEMELRLTSVELASYDGTLCWKITEFSRKRHDAVTGKTTSIYSPSFYTGRIGYKMCSRLYPNGDGMGKGSHLSLFFVLQRGHYDAMVPFPFKHKVSLILVDQTGGKDNVVDAFRPDPNSSSFKRPTTEMNIASGCPLFMPLANLERVPGKYIRDDTIFIKVVIDILDKEQPYTEQPNTEQPSQQVETKRK